MLKPRCPVCNRESATKYDVGSGDKHAEWIHCLCGCIYNISERPKVFNEEYRNSHDCDKVKRRYDYFDRTYMNLIEQLTYGRKFLDVGFELQRHIDNLRKRGWITNGIDLINNNYITGDFETHNFDGELFDYVLMGNVLQSFNDPIKALEKARGLLKPTGILFITTPDTDLVYDVGLIHWGHWKKQDYVYFSERQLRKELEKLDFDIIYCHINTSLRFTVWNDLHIIAQRKYVKKDIINDSNINT